MNSIENLGISTGCLPKSNWNFIVEELNIKHLEIDLRKSYLPKNEKLLLEKVRPFLSKYNLSIHSRCKIPLNRIDRELIKQEISLMKILGIKNMVIHISKDLIDDGNIEKDIKFIRSFGINPLIENNSKMKFSDPYEIVDFLNKYDLKLCLDIGHAEIFSERNGVDIVDFFNKVRDFIGEIHIKGVYYEDYDCIFDPRKNMELSKSILTHPAPKIVETRDVETALITLGLLRNIPI